MATANSTCQLVSTPAMRGRVMALYAMVFLGSTPIGGPIIGWIDQAVGARYGMATGGVATVLAALVTGAVLVRRQFVARSAVRFETVEASSEPAAA
jgi:MFS family permease